MTAPPPVIEIRLSDSESCSFTPSVDTWLDMQAYCAVSGLTIQELIVRAMEHGLADGLPFLTDGEER